MASADELDRLDRELSDLSLAAVVRVDQLADEFEAELRAGRMPDAAAYVARLEQGGDAARLLGEHLQHLAAELSNPTAGEAGSSGFAAPQQVGEYRILERLGAGGMGIVFQARHQRLDRLVALKFPRYASLLEADAAARFVREAKLLGQLEHPHIVRALDAGDSPYGPYLVTEFIAGETVEQLVRREGALPWRRAFELAAEAANGLAHAHARQIIHRDVKPSNLLLDERGVVRVVDFGLAKTMIADAESDVSTAAGQATDFSRAADFQATGAGAFLGTVGFAAPEQLGASVEIGPTADVYSLGCVIYFMLRGEAPHRGSLADRLRAEGKRGATLMLERADVPREVEAAWRRFVAPRPEDRVPTMAEAERLLRQALAGELPAERDAERCTRRAAFAAVGVAVISGVAWQTWRANRSGVGSSRRALPSGPAPPVAKSPLTAERLREIQQAWARYLDLPLRWQSPGGAPLVLLPPGEFAMGLGDEELATALPPEGDWRYRTAELEDALHRPQHRVVISRPFYFGETEVTNAQFRKFVEAADYVTDCERSSGWGREDKGWVKRRGYSWKNLGQRVCVDDYPVMNVTWNDAIAYCEWLSSLEPERTFRLPTEAEWEYAARAGSDSHYHFGDDSTMLGEHAWFGDNSEGLYRAVATRQANPFGLYDLYGNRQEWCLDGYEVDFYEQSPTVDPVCEARGVERVMRGGAHTDLARFCSAVTRWGQEADNPGAAGMRIVSEIA
ncbi:bifunctional serine/threonine-protein kinase/formylglycine-generating enzyme family protein [Lacipirellula parvula]|uniref:Protein kinase domain-containing protein n=1 Tax=Lacipirellula parvula TaxID=2650471 RepID=A0A5K7XM44_9BACT|nr:bifunctional serine/threonine-protein kinase/formylglycine-generating enzyme family protein [Lacipirellula parvula]BBO36481.1 hypothetical protein PLANPX_6093 [Lacipirellula parvula]